MERDLTPLTPEELAEIEQELDITKVHIPAQIFNYLERAFLTICQCNKRIAELEAQLKKPAMILSGSPRELVERYKNGTPEEKKQVLKMLKDNPNL